MLEVRQLDHESARDLAADLVAFGEDLDWDDWTPENLLTERPDKWRFSLVALRSGVPVAYAVASRKGDAVHLHHIVVDRSSRGGGVGARMLEELLHRAREEGMAAVTLKVAVENDRAVGFYDRAGFRVARTLDHGYYEMRRDLTL